MSENQRFSIPPEVLRVTKALKNVDFEVYLIGGCVRDLLRREKPRDWDVTTNAKPEEVQKIFEHTFYENDFGTVGVVNDGVEDKSLEVVEVTTFRLEGPYKDARRPEEVTFSSQVVDDLKRRDFTINAIAYDPHTYEIVDPYDGQKDIKDKIIRAVGDAAKRFQEDALRIVRAVRLATELDFEISRETAEAMAKTAPQLEKIAKERIRDELSRILESKEPMRGVILSHELGILRYIIPELENGVEIEQNQAHTYDVWGHNLRSAQHAADKNWSFELRLAALLHDISKPETRRFDKAKGDWTFHGHEVVGAKVARKILDNLKFPKKTVEKISKLVRWHMFFSDPEQITLSAVRRMIRNVGEENIWDLMNLRICDRVGTGRPKEQPYRFRKYKAMIEEALRDPISVGMLKIDGNDLIKDLGLEPGPKIGNILHALLEEVLGDPEKNTKDYLAKRAGEMALLKDEELVKLGEQGKARKGEAEAVEVNEIRGKYWVE